MLNDNQKMGIGINTSQMALPHKSTELTIIEVEGKNGVMNPIYALMNNGHGCKSYKSGYNGGVPSCHDTAVGDYNSQTGEVESPGCGYICCQIEPDSTKGSGNSIIMEPEELTSIKSHIHLEKIATHKGVQLVDCITGICDGEIDVKPNDCKRYPFLPIITEDNKLKFMHGIRSKCPMPEPDRMLHLGYTILSVLESLKSNPGSKNTFLHGHEKMVGYEDYSFGYLANITPEEMAKKADIQIAIALERERKRIEIFAPSGTETIKGEMLNAFKIDLEAMRDANLKNYRQLQKIGVEFSDEGIDLDHIDYDRLVAA